MALELHDCTKSAYELDIYHSDQMAAAHAMLLAISALPESAHTHIVTLAKHAARMVADTANEIDVLGEHAARTLKAVRS